jgi:hypothetical protein
VSDTPHHLGHQLDGLDGCTVLVCSGLDCAVASDRILSALRPIVAAAPGGVLVSTGCLHACTHAPVTIIDRRPTRHTPGFAVAVTLTASTALADLAGWVAAGGPGVAPMPARLDRALFAVH